MRIRTVALLGALLMCGSCIRSPVAMMTASKPVAPGSYQELGSVEETDCLWLLFGVIPISTGNNLQGALQDATKSAGGDALIQVTAETYYQNFLVVARHCSIVQGIAVRMTNR